MRGGFRLFLVLTPALFTLDQLVKIWSRTAAQGVDGKTLLALWPEVFELKLVYNEGVAFGMFRGLGLFLTPVAVGIACAATWYSWKHPSDKPLSHITAALLASGAVGNLVDRLVNGKVTDMFYIRAINFPVFNVADMCITFAGALLLIASLKDMLVHKKPVAAEDATGLGGETYTKP